MEKTCTLLVHFDKGTPALGNEIKKTLEGNNEQAKVEAMRMALMLLLNGETIPQLFMTVIQSVLPSENHKIQKLLLLYLETIDTTDSGGNMLPEMNLICEILRNNLQHRKCYLRGVTLRFLCRLNEIEIIKTVIPYLLSNLTHKHPFVRRNAVLAVMSIYKLPLGKLLLVDAPVIIEVMLSTEQHPSVKRISFLMLSTCAQERAVSYLLASIGRISDWGEQLQMVALELIKKVCRTKKLEKGKYIKIIISLLAAPSSAIIYECAGTLVSFSSAPAAISLATDAYCKLLRSQIDNNVKLVVLDRLQKLKCFHNEIILDKMFEILLMYDDDCLRFCELFTHSFIGRMFCYLDLFLFLKLYSQ